MDCCSIVLPKYSGLWEVFSESRGRPTGEIEGPDEGEQDFV